MLEAKQINSSATTKSSFIMISKDYAFFWFSSQFQAHGNGRMKTSLNNQCPLDWLRTQTITTRERQSITI
jgi:hypothetical protein